MSANVRPGPSTDELNGLNWQVQVDPLTLTITTLPPTLPVLAAVDEVPDAVVDEVLDELPQAATNKHTAAKDMSHMKRFIDILRSPFADRQPSLAQTVYGLHLARAREPIGQQRRGRRS
jgi:hypothetical protein